MSPDPDTHEFLLNHRWHHPQCSARNVTPEGHSPCTCEELIDAEWNDYYKGDVEESESDLLEPSSCSVI